MPEKPEGQQFEPGLEKQEESEPETSLDKSAEQLVESQPQTEEKDEESSFASVSVKDTTVEKVIEDKKNLCPACGLPLEDGDHTECEKAEETAPDKEKAEIKLTKEQEEAKQEMIRCLSNGEVDDALEIKDIFQVPKEVAQSAAKEGLIECLSRRWVNSALEIKDKFQVPEEVLRSPELQSAAKEEMIECLSGGEVNYALKIKDIFQVPEEVVQSAAKAVMIKYLSKGQVNSALEIKDKFQVPEEVVQSAAKEEMIECLSKGQVNSALEIKDKFQVPEEVLRSPELQSAAKEEMIECLSDGEVNYALKIKDIFQVPEEVVQSAAKEGLIECLSKGEVDDALEIKDKFQVPEEAAQSSAKQGMIHCLSNGQVDFALEIKDKFQVPEEVLRSPELQSVAKQRMISCFFGGLVYSALEIREKLSVRITPQEIIDAFPDMQELLVKLQEKSPQFYSQAMRSIEVVLSLFIYRKTPEKLFETIEENPFLFDAVERNPRFGSKLLVKFESLDKASKENIQFLFNAKNEIMGANPEMDPESLEFRQAMQEKLKDFKRNPEIKKEIEASGIDVEQWLAYDAVRYFALESGKNTVAFSETIATPINRIKETIDSYAHLIKETLKQYHKELSEYQIPVAESSGIDEKIAKMRIEYDKAKREGNEKKSQGILKGIESAEKFKEKIATVSIWNKLINTINSFQLLKNDVHLAHERATEEEAKFQELTAQKAPSGKEIRTQKEKIAKAKEELKTKFNVLERRMDDFRDTLKTAILPALGEERSVGLIQEIQQGFQEQLTHYDVDRSTLANLFSERQDTEKEKLESQPMSIFVWARNPDIDLYQANYSPCCISIESGYHADGAESTIADYNTDLGIQIVNIWDETKQEPVTAAWCWLGKDEKGTPVLVVDNIESNTMYTSNYPEQLGKELFEFLKEYARTIGAKKVVLGKRNNDLPTAGEITKLKDDENSYTKIGGSNRSDGYFLEAEKENVKIVWDKKDEKLTRKKIEKKEKKEVPNVKFGDFKTTVLTEKDFQELLKLERKIYQEEDEDLIQGQSLIQDINDGKGLEYSIMLRGSRKGKKTSEILGYIVGVEDKTNEDEPCVYLEDIAVAPEAQGQGIGWNMMEAFAQKLKERAQEQKKPVLLDMHLRPNSQRFMEKHKEDLEKLGVKLLEEAVENDYYGEGDDALYQLYEVRE